MRIRVALASFALLLLAPSVAFASLADEQRQGQALAAQLQSGAKSCSDLSAEDFDHIGEYVMGRFLGSTVAHQAMNDRMRLMLGAQAEGRMHQLMGARFAGCATSTGAANGYGSMMGQGMMGGNYGNGDWGAMMRSGDWNWMMGGNWRNMSRQDWQRLQRQWLGTSATDHHAWSGWAIAGASVGAVLLAALAIVALARRPFRRPPTAASPS